MHNKDIDNRFFYDERKTNGGIRLSDNFYQVAESPSFYDLNQETESRFFTHLYAPSTYKICVHPNS